MQGQAILQALPIGADSPRPAARCKRRLALRSRARSADLGRMSVYPVSLLVDRNVQAAAKAICLIWHDDDLATANEGWFADRAPYERAALRVLTAVDG